MAPLFPPPSPSARPSPRSRLLFTLVGAFWGIEAYRREKIAWIETEAGKGEVWAEAALALDRHLAPRESFAYDLRTWIPPYYLSELSPARPAWWLPRRSPIPPRPENGITSPAPYRAFFEPGPVEEGTLRRTLEAWRPGALLLDSGAAFLPEAEALAGEGRLIPLHRSERLTLYRVSVTPL